MVSQVFTHFTSAAAQLLADLQWWIPISWLLAAAAIWVAILNFRRSRHANIRLHRLDVEYEHGEGGDNTHRWLKELLVITRRYGRPSDEQPHMYFVVELLSVGTDIYDLAVWLEYDDFRWYWYDWRWHRAGEREAVKFVPIGDLPNPIKNGQVAKFQLGDQRFCKRAKGELGDFDPRCLSQLWPSRVRIVVSHSGDRILLKRSSWRFRRRLRKFDSLAREQAVRYTKAARAAWEKSHGKSADGTIATPTDTRRSNARCIRKM